MSIQVEKLVVFPKPDGKFWVRRMIWEIKDDGPHFISYAGNLVEGDQKNPDVAAYLALNPKDQHLIGNVAPPDERAGVIGRADRPSINYTEQSSQSIGSTNERADVVGQQTNPGKPR